MKTHKKLSENIPFFRFRRMEDRFLLTNDVGEHCLMTSVDFEKMLSGSTKTLSSEKLLELQEKSFLGDTLNLAKLTQKYSSRHAFLSTGTSLHIVVVTLRCNHRCVYCQTSSRRPKDTCSDMDTAVAMQVVDRIFESPSRAITIEFQGGEPLLNFETVRFIIEYASDKNKSAKKNLIFSLVSNLASLTKDQFEYLIKKNICICTSLDGPKELHKKHRIPLDRAVSYKNTIDWFKKFKKRFKDGRFLNRINALATITKLSFPFYKDIVDEYIKLGLNNISLRPVNPFGTAGKNWKKIGFTAEDFLAFYKKTLDYILKKNLEGETISERSAFYFLQKILTDTDPNYLESRSPCGAGIGQLAYNFNGDIYTCDEGRMLGEMGDSSFRIGHVATHDYQEIQKSPILKTLCVASCLDNLAGCSSCAYLPYCGVCPIYNLTQENNIFGHEPHNVRCKINQGILDLIFQYLEDAKYRAIFQTWIQQTADKI